MIIDYATLTGAARVALGQDLPAMFANNDVTATELQDISMACEDPVWHMPLWAPYKRDLDSTIADMNNVGNAGGLGGAIHAALFLKEFVKPDTDWIHIDTFGWRNSPSPGRPKGGEAYGMRAVFELIRQRYT